MTPEKFDGIYWKLFEKSYWKVWNAQIFKGPLTPIKFDRMFSKVNQVIYSSSPFSWPSFKLLAYIFRDFLLTSLKCPNFQRAMTPEKFDGIYWKVKQVIYSPSPISWPSFKPPAQILFEITCWQEIILIFSKGHNSRKGDNSDKKTNTAHLFFHEESRYEISKS